MNTSVSQVLGLVNSQLPETIQLYITALLKAEGKKSCPKMADQLGLSHDKIYRCLNPQGISYEDQQKFFVGVVQLLATKEAPGHLCGDDSCLRRFATNMEGADKMHSSIEEKVVIGQCPVVLCWSNGKVTIPIAWDFWQSKKSVKKGTFRTKTKIMKELIAQIADNIPFSYILLDGLYQSDAMMDYLDALKIKFLMRLPRNRTIRCSEGAPAFKIGNHWAYRLQRNQRSRATKGILNGKMRYIAVEKRKDTMGSYQTVFLISNFETEAKKYLSIYMLRWDIEQFFRTSKQSLGLGDCQAIYLKRQRLHMFSVFVSFAIADSIKYFCKLECTGDGIRYLKNFISDILYSTKPSHDQVLYAIA